MGNILEIKNLVIHYEMQDGVVKALNDVTLELKEGSAHGLVGETGAGKTTLAKGIMRLTPAPHGKVKGGQVLYDGRDVLQMNSQELRGLRGKHISMIFQDPMTSLNPVLTVGAQIEESLSSHERLSAAQLRQRAGEILEMVGIPAQRAGEYPHQFSGGMKQRVVIAIALALNPRVLIADEPTTALDVTIQAQVLEMISGLRKKLGTSMFLITHDLGVVAQNCEYVSIMYAGEVVETGTVHDVFRDHLHPYTQGLFSSIPNINEETRRLTPIQGLMPDPTNLPRGCAFCERCEHARERCGLEHPPLYEVGGEEGGHRVRCFRCDPRGKEGER